MAVEEGGYQAPYQRSLFPRTDEAVLNEIGKQLADLQVTRGGNIIMVQVENEYGAYATDKAYIANIRDG